MNDVRQAVEIAGMFGQVVVGAQPQGLDGDFLVTLIADDHDGYVQAAFLAQLFEYFQSVGAGQTVVQQEDVTICK